MGKFLEISEYEIASAEPGDLVEKAQDLLSWILFHAMRSQVSDIHIDQYRRRMRVRFSIDGELSTFYRESIETLNHIGAVIKNLAEMNIAEKIHPMDGRFTTGLGGKNIEFRVSAIPNAWGAHDFTLRMIDDSMGNKSLHSLNLDTAEFDLIQQAITRSHGLILVTGPTGSGKTTTLYAMLNEIATSERKIQTIEDPIEYVLDGVSQAQVRDERGVGFADMLRSIVRAAPNVIMIGEIRDTQTAKVAANAANTGHLVFSTLHTNDSFSAISRLLEFGVPDYLLADTLLMIVAQRLVRKLCKECAREEPITQEIYEHFMKHRVGLPDQLQSVFSPVGCEKCRKSGYNGRVPVMEIVGITDDIRHLILSQAEHKEFMREVKKNYYAPTLYQRCLLEVMRGVTSLQEVEKFKPFAGFAMHSLAATTSPYPLPRATTAITKKASTPPASTPPPPAKQQLEPQPSPTYEAQADLPPNLLSYEEPALAEEAETDYQQEDPEPHDWRKMGTLPPPPPPITHAG